MITGASQPVLPNGDAAVAIGINVTVRMARNAPGDREYLGLQMRVAIGQHHLDIKRGYEACRVGNGAVLKDQIGAVNENIVVVGSRAQLWLRESDGRLHFPQRQLPGCSYDLPKASTAIPCAGFR